MSNLRHEQHVTVALHVVVAPNVIVSYGQHVYTARSVEKQTHTNERHNTKMILVVYDDESAGNQCTIKNNSIMLS